jgi:hypothetical protein
VQVDWVGSLIGTLIVLFGVCLFIWRRPFANWSARLQRSTFQELGEPVARSSTAVVFGVVAVLIACVGGLFVVVSLLPH